MNTYFREFINALIVGVAIYMVFVAIEISQGTALKIDENLLRGFSINMIYSVIIYMLNMILFRVFYTRYKKKSALYTSAHLIRAVSLGIVVTLIGAFVANAIISFFYFGVSLSDFIKGEKLSKYYVTFTVSMAVTVVVYAAFYYRYKKETQVKEQKIIAGAASAQFDALKNQLDPHFLFNSLNVLTSLIEEDPERATHFTTSLSKVYRYVLEQKNKELVTVDEELAFARTYITLMDMRFEDSILIDMPKRSSNPEAKVVPLSLQLLLENAVKHNRVTQGDKLHIGISEEQGYLVVKNNLRPKKVMGKSTGVGLQNIRQRYHLLTKRKMQIAQDATHFSVALPILTKQLTAVTSTKQYISDKKYARAKEHVEKLRGFYMHLTTYLLIAPIMIGINIYSSPYPWAIFPLAGWGIGLAFHAAIVYGWNPFLTKDWEERQIRKMMKREEHRESTIQGKN